MMRFAKIVMMVQFITCFLLPPLLFNLPLEVARVAMMAQQVADQPHVKQIPRTAEQAAEVAAFLHSWKVAFPWVLMLPVLAGCLSGGLGWWALSRKAEKLMSPKVDR